MKFKINLITIISILVLSVSGCEEDNLKEESISKSNNINYIIESNDSEIISKGDDVIRKSGGITFDHDIIMNYKSKELSASKMKVYNPENTSEYMIINITKAKDDYGEFQVDLSNGISKSYTINLHNNVAKTGPRGRLLKKIAKLVKEIIEDANESGGSSGASSCAQTAVTTCGEGNVSSVNYESGWFSSSCSFECC